MKSTAALAATLIAAFVMIAVPASPSTGEITSAVASPDWIHGSVAGSVAWDQCPEGCQWTAFAYVEPSLPEYHCGSEDLFNSDPNVRQIWNSGAQTTNGTTRLNVTNAAILPGVFGQKACLVVVYHRSYIDPICRTQAEVLEGFGGPPWETVCLSEDHTLFEPHGSRVFTVEPATSPVIPAPVVPPPAVIVAPSIPVAPSTHVVIPKPLTQAQKLAKALKACRKDRKKGKRVACEKQAHRKYGPHKKASAG